MIIKSSKKNTELKQNIYDKKEIITVVFDGWTFGIL